MRDPNRSWTVLVTAEHGGYAVPPAYRELFRDRDALLRSHRGWDPGTLDLARRLASRFEAPLFASDVTRLLVDLNRSAHHPRVFSEVTRPLARPERMALIEGHHRPHRDAVRAAVADAVGEGARVVHLGVHSFTPELHGVTRVPDLALLYDPQRSGERELAAEWTRALAAALPARAIRRNDPYRGNADGLTTALRAIFADADYLGIEVEVNQRHLGNGMRFPAWVEKALTETLAGSAARALD